MSREFPTASAAAENAREEKTALTCRCCGRGAVSFSASAPLDTLVEQ